MTLGPWAAFVPVLVLAVALWLGPLPFAVRGMMRPVLGPAATRRWTKEASLGVGIGLIAAVGLAAVMAPDLALTAALLALLFLLAVIDWHWRWLPLEWSLGVIALALLFALQSGDPLQVIIGMITPAAVLLAVRQALIWLRGIEALGLGDIWLVAGLGGFLLPFESFLLLGLAALTGLIEIGVRRGLQGPAALRHPVSYGTHLCLIFVLLRNLASIS